MAHNTFKRRRRQHGGKTFKKPDPTCQCMDVNTNAPCKRIALFGSLFCKEHAKCPGSPISGYEPAYEPWLWLAREIKESMNCYAYAFDVRDPLLISKCRKNNGNDCRQYFPQPGAVNGDRNALDASERRNCAVVEHLMKLDVPEVKKTDFYSKCPPGHSKIALVVDPGEDYHFYRQDPDGYWSHKAGSGKVKREDALRRRIFNPAGAVRDSRWEGSDLNYTDFCGFYCVPRNHPILLGQGGDRLAVAAKQTPKKQAAGTRRRRLARQAAGAVGEQPHHQTRRILRSGLP